MNKTDLQKMIDSRYREFKDYRDLSKLDFLLKYNNDFQKEINKDFELYKNDNKKEDLMTYLEWIEEYQEEMEYDLEELVKEYFYFYDKTIYKDKENDETIIDLLLI
jgi:hypothetical protein